MSFPIKQKINKEKKMRRFFKFVLNITLDINMKKMYTDS